MRLKDEERLYPKSWGTSLAGFAEITAWGTFEGEINSADHEKGRSGQPKRGLTVVALKSLAKCDGKCNRNQITDSLHGKRWWSSNDPMQGRKGIGAAQGMVIVRSVQSD